MNKLKNISWVLLLVGTIVVIAACGQTSSGPMGSEGPQGLAGQDGLAGEDGLNGTNGAACSVVCDGRSHTIISCPDSEVRFKVKNCE